VDELAALIKTHYWTRGYKVLLCAQDVADDLAGSSAAPAAPRRPWEMGLDTLMAVNVIVTPDSPPGSWRLVRHDHCTVNLATGEDGHPDLEKSYVSHEGCTVLGESPGSGPAGDVPVRE
jgi:hypothetical protein